MAAYNCRWFKSSGGTLPVNQKRCGKVFFVECSKVCKCFGNPNLEKLGWFFVAKNGRRMGISPPRKFHSSPLKAEAESQKGKPHRLLFETSFQRQISLNFVRWDISLKFDIDTKNSRWYMFQKHYFWGIHVSFSWLFMLWIALMRIVFYCTFWGRHVLVGKVS